jgi:glycosyltransferase involved in cell wall biosynthesis
MSEPRVAILTAAYNHERFIARCLESVLAQTMGDWQMFVLDDGSTDATCEIVRGYRDPRISLLQEPHQGIWTMGVRYNRALARARAPLLAILDGDDWWPPEKLGIQCRTFDDADTVLCHGSAHLHDEEAKPLVRRPLIKTLRGKIPGLCFLESLLTRRHIPWSPTAITRTPAVRALGGFVQPAYAPLVDYPTWAHIAPLGCVRGMPEVLGYYRIRAGSISRGMAEQVVEGNARFVRDFLATQGDKLGIAQETRRLYIRWSDAARDQELARVRMKQGRTTAARDLFRRAIQAGPPWLKTRASLRLFQTVFMGTPRSLV